MATRLGGVEGNPWTTPDQTMITTIMCMVAVLFGLKIIWNIFTPVVLARRSLLATTDKPTGISMAPFVEVVLLVVLILLSALSNGSAWFNHPLQVALWGGVIIVGSYVLFVVFGIGLGWLVAQIKKRRA